MGKVALFPVLILAACLTAGLYGMLHNQISYTVSLDYFHAFKFHQFRIPEVWHGRIGAALVGWRASWWMEVLIGVPVLLVGLIMPDWKSYLRHGFIAIAVAAGTTLLVGLAALAYAYATISETTLPGFYYPEGLRNNAAFARAGLMHNFSYLGGFLGIFTSSIYLLIARIGQKKNVNDVSNPPTR